MRSRKIVILLVLLVGGTSIYASALRRYYRHLTPTSRLLREFARAMPSPQDVFLLERNGRVYVEVVGPSAPTWVVASGWPVYVFDETGNLIAWTPDDGEDPDFCKRWALTAEEHRTRRISLDEAVARLAAKHSVCGVLKHTLPNLRCTGRRSLADNPHSCA